MYVVRGKRGKEQWECVSGSEAFSKNLFREVYMPLYTGDDTQFAFHTNIGSLTVLDRMTGFGWRDTETGFRDTEGNFWLASGGFDVRLSGAKTISEAIQWVKSNANTCIGVPSYD